MAQLQQVFDATQVDPTQGSGSLPVGKHPVIISNSEITGTKDGANGMVVLELTIIDGPQKGTTGAYRLNLYHSNQTAAQIAQKQLSALCHVTQTFQLQDTAQLHNKPFVIEVGLQKGPEAAEKGYTEVKKVFDMAGNEPGKAPAAAQNQQPVQQPAAQQAAPQGQAAWGQPAPAAAQQPAAQQPQAAWGQQPPQGQPAPAAAQQAAPAWGQGAPAGGTPAWGR